MAKKVISIGDRTPGASGHKKSAGFSDEDLKEVIDLVRSAKNKLGNITLNMDAEIPEAGALEDALETLDDAIDIMEDTLDGEGF